MGISPIMMIMAVVMAMAKEALCKRKYYVHWNKRGYNVREKAYNIPYAHALK